MKKSQRASSDADNIRYGQRRDTNTTQASPPNRLQATLDQAHLADLRDDAQRTRDPLRRSKVLEKLVARDGLVLALMETDEDQNLDIDISKGFAAEEWRRETLGIQDIWVNGYLIGLSLVSRDASTISLSRAQVEAQSAPDVWAFVTFDQKGSRIQVEVVGWVKTADAAKLPMDRHGKRQLPLAQCSAPEELLAFVMEPLDSPRVAQVQPGLLLLSELRAGLQRLETLDTTTLELMQSTLGLPLTPLSSINPPLFDCLVADRTAAEAYVEAVTRAVGFAPTLFAPRHLAEEARAIAQGKVLPQPSAPLVETLLGYLARNELTAALDLLSGTTEPQLLCWRAAILSLRGNLIPAFAAAREAFRQAPLSLFGPVPAPHFAFAWQYVPEAGMAVAGQVEVIDVARPDNDPTLEKGEAELRADNGDTVFSLGLRLPTDYAGFRFRCLVIDQRVRNLLGLTDQRDFRRAFSRAPTEPPTEQEHILVVEGMILTTKGGVLEGTVSHDGIIDIWEPVQMVTTRTENSLNHKTVAVVVYSPEVYRGAR
ncbi:MAG: hypothetical protein U0822_09925 [Anaerolineae bacterium]